MISEAVQDGIDEDRLLGIALMHRVGSLIYLSVLDLNLQRKFSREFMHTLQKVYTYDCARTESYHICVEKLINMLLPAEIPYALLKGAYLIRRYPKGTRISNDIDLLIESRYLPAVSGILSANGFEQGYLKNGIFEKADRRQIIMSKLNRGETVPFVKKVDMPALEYLEVDLNFSLDYLPSDEGGYVKKMLSDIKDFSNPFLRFEDFIIHLCCHLYKEAIVYEWVKMGRDQKLYKYCDLYWLLRNVNDSDKWQKLEMRIHELELEEACAYALRNTRELFQMMNPLLDKMLESMEIFDLKKVISPTDKKIFTYNKPILDWVFLSNKSNNLIEVK